jgi:hypothetical protein
VQTNPFQIPSIFPACKYVADIHGKTQNTEMKIPDLFVKVVLLTLRDLNGNSFSMLTIGTYLDC